MKTLNQFMEMKGFKDEVARVDRNAEQVAARKKRQARTDAALNRVREKEAQARRGAPERAARAERNKAAQERVASVERKANMQGQVRRAPSVTPKKPTTSSAPTPQPTPESQPSKPKSRKDDSSLDTQIKSQRLDDMRAKRAQRDADYADKKERQAKRAREEGAKDTVEKRKGGLGAGVKSAFGGDVIGMRAKKDDDEETRDEIKKTNRKNRAEFSKKKTQQFGNFVKSAGRAAGRAALTDKDQDRTQVAGPSGDVSGGSSYQSRTQRN